MVGQQSQKCFGVFIHFWCAQSSLPTKCGRSLSIISIQSRFVPLAQTCSTAGTTAVVHLLATREGNSGHSHSHSELRGLQQVTDVSFVMFQTARWTGSGPAVHWVCVRVKRISAFHYTYADHDTCVLHSLDKFTLDMEICFTLAYNHVRLMMILWYTVINAGSFSQYSADH